MRVMWDDVGFTKRNLDDDDGSNVWIFVCIARRSRFFVSLSYSYLFSISISSNWHSCNTPGSGYSMHL